MQSFTDFEPQYSYELYSYKKESVYVVLIAFVQSSFCCLLRCIIISGMHRALSLSTNMHAHWNSTIFAMKVLRRFSYWNRENVAKASVLGQTKLSFRKNNTFGICFIKLDLENTPICKKFSS